MSDKAIILRDEIVDAHDKMVAIYGEIAVVRKYMLAVSSEGYT